jgi:ribosomal protein L10
MNGSLRGRRALVGLVLSLVCLTGCPAPKGGGGNAGPDASSGSKGTPTEAPARAASAKAEDVDAAKKLLDGLGANGKCTILPGSVLTEIVIQDGSVLSAEKIALFGKLTDLEKLQIYNFRELNDEMASQLAGLKELTTLALTNSVINDSTVEMIAKSFPKLVDLDLSSNTNLTNGVLKVICGVTDLQRLMLVQNRFNDLGTSHLSKLQDLRSLDLRGNMEAGDMTMEVIAALPKLTSLKHRSTAVSDFGMEYLAGSKTLDSLLMQDFVVTGQAGQHIAKLGSLTQLEIFRCQGFTSDGVAALKGMKLTRLTLRDLPAVDDQAMQVFTDLPELKRLYLHELASISDNGLQNLAAIKSLEVLDIWTVPQMTDATVEVIASLPNLKELSIRTTGVTDAVVDKLLAMPGLQSLTFKENGQVTADGLKKLAGKKWAKLDIGSAETGDGGSP